MKAPAPSWTAGGSAASSARLVSALGRPAMFCGGAGADEAAELFAAFCSRSRLLAGLQIHPDLPTGRCICLINGLSRTLVANIGASKYFTKDYLEGDSMKINLQRCRIMYIEGFFLENRFDACTYLVERYLSQKYFSYSLSAPYVIDSLSAESQYMAEHCDIVFGNEKEYIALGNSFYGLNGGEESAIKLHEVSRMMAEKLEENQDVLGRFGKIVIMTNEDKPVLIVWGRDRTESFKYAVPVLDQRNIIDTTGAGDSFVAGFLQALLSGASLQAATKYAVQIATIIIGVEGVPVMENLPLFVQNDNEN